MSIFGKKSSSGHEIGKMTADDFLAESNFISPEVVISSSERRAKTAELKRELKEKIDELKILLRSFESVLTEEEKYEFEPKIKTAEELIQLDEPALALLENTNKFINNLLIKIKKQI